MRERFGNKITNFAMKRTSERGIATATDFQNANGNMKNLVNEASVSISPSKQARPTLTITSQP